MRTGYYLKNVSAFIFTSNDGEIDSSMKTYSSQLKYNYFHLVDDVFYLVDDKFLIISNTIMKLVLH